MCQALPEKKICKSVKVNFETRLKYKKLSKVKHVNRDGKEIKETFNDVIDRVYSEYKKLKKENREFKKQLKIK